MMEKKKNHLVDCYDHLCQLHCSLEGVWLLEAAVLKMTHFSCLMLSLPVFREKRKISVMETNSSFGLIYSWDDGPKIIIISWMYMQKIPLRIPLRISCIGLSGIELISRSQNELTPAI